MCTLVFFSFYCIILKTNWETNWETRECKNVQKITKYISFFIYMLFYIFFYNIINLSLCVFIFLQCASQDQCGPAPPSPIQPFRWRRRAKRAKVSATSDLNGTVVKEKKLETIASVSRMYHEFGLCWQCRSCLIDEVLSKCCVCEGTKSDSGLEGTSMLSW